MSVMKQWYKRRKQDANCYVGDKFMDPVEHEENCPCTDADYEWCVYWLFEICADACCFSDYNFIKQGAVCVPAGPERIPAGVCTDPDQEYLGSSGYRKIPGNTCTGGSQKERKVQKKCSQAQPEEGNVVHQTVSNLPQQYPIDLLIFVASSSSQVKLCNMHTSINRRWVF